MIQVLESPCVKCSKALTCVGECTVLKEWCRILRIICTGIIKGTASHVWQDDLIIWYRYLQTHLPNSTSGVTGLLTTTPSDCAKIP
ncbi:MAG: hypothetical protein ABFC94_19495 [Syntrophomonas sp.]